PAGCTRCLVWGRRDARDPADHRSVCRSPRRAGIVRHRLSVDARDARRCSPAHRRDFRHRSRAHAHRGLCALRAARRSRRRSGDPGGTPDGHRHVAPSSRSIGPYRAFALARRRLRAAGAIACQPSRRCVAVAALDQFRGVRSGAQSFAMSTAAEALDIDAAGIRREGMRIAGERVERPRTIAVHNPYTGALVGTVPKATVDDVRRALSIAKSYRAKLTRYERYDICHRVAAIIRSRAAGISDLITAECGICKKDSLYEVGRASDVFTFGGNAALNDDGQIFSCDLTPHGKSRKVYTLREPLQGVIAAITPFNHPLNQVAHKIAPSIATNNRMVLKPTERTPLSALLLADILYEAGLPPEMLAVVTGDPAQIADEMSTSADV